MALSRETNSREDASAIIDLALAEDTAEGDATSEALLPPGLHGRAVIIAKDRGILAGGEIAAGVFHKVDPELDFKLLIRDGSELKPGNLIATVSGNVAGILKGERLALNFLQRLSGVASQTALYVTAVKGTGAEIYDTRKTTPGFRTLEKYAVRMGGGCNHRMHLGDAVLIKDTHIAALRARGMSIAEIVTTARNNARKGITIEIEVNTPQEAVEAAGAGADIIMLDNMNPVEMKEAVDLLHGRVRTEASGGITLESVRAVAETGVDIISVGALTHSTKALDISLEIETD